MSEPPTRKKRRPEKKTAEPEKKTAEPDVGFVRRPRARSRGGAFRRAARVGFVIGADAKEAPKPASRGWRVQLWDPARRRRLPGAGDPPRPAAPPSTPVATPAPPATADHVEFGLRLLESLKDGSLDLASAQKQLKDLMVSGTPPPAAASPRPSRALAPARRARAQGVHAREDHRIRRSRRLPHARVGKEDRVAQSRV